MRDFTLKRKWERAILTIIFFIAIFTGAFAQNATITGKITDAVTNEPVVGAAVQVQGTKVGIGTDVNGNFKLTASPNATLVIKSVGYETLTVTAKSGAMSIKLNPTNSALNEVVVVGYGTEKKATLTGSIATVSAKAFQDRGPIDNPIAAMQGTVPGTVVTRSSAAPGREGWNIQINGTTSINGSDPLYVIDGVPMSVPQTSSGATLTNNTNGNLSATQSASYALSSLNPDDIESVSILKDASAAIYGARAAGGVVLITTKRGKKGKATVAYNGSASVKAMGNGPHLATGTQYGQGLVDAVTNDYGGNPPANYVWLRLGQAYLGPNAGSFIDLTQYNGQPIAPANNPLNPGFGDVKDLPLFNTNAISQLYRNTTSTTHDLSISGGNEKDVYRVSLGYMNDGSLLRYGQNSNKRYNLRFSNDFTISDRFKISTSVSLEENDVTIPTQIGIIYQFSQPGLPAFSSNGQAYAWGTQLTPPGELRDGGSNIEDNTRIYTNLKATYNITKNLDLVAYGGYNRVLSNVNTIQNAVTFYNYLGNYAYPPTALSPANSYALRQQTTDNFYNANAYLYYHNTFARNHNVALTVGSSLEKDKNDTFFGKTTALFNSNLVSTLGTGVGAANTYTNGESAAQGGIQSYFSRFNYNYSQKYLLEAQARIDGSSKFDPVNRYKTFAGISGGWVATEESFLKDQKVFSLIKLRVSYGQAGNQNGIGLYDYINQLGLVYATGIVNGPPIIGSGNVIQVNPNATLVSLNRTWETISTDNAGLDFATLNNRLSGSFDYYIKHNNNMLLSQTLPQVLGANAPQANIGTLKTTGWNFGITWRDRIGTFTYHAGINLSNYNNTLTNIGGASVIPSGFGNVQGYSINSYFGLQYAGRIQTQSQADAMNAMLVGSNIPGAATKVRIGDNSYADVTGDGKVTTADYKYLGRDDPNYVGSLNLGFEYKGFDFNMIWTGVGKRTIYRGGNWIIPFGSIYQGQEDFWVGKTWTPSNTGAYYPLLSGGINGTTYNTYNYQPSTWSVENGAYLRLKNLVVGYTIKSRAIQNAGISRLRIYLSGTDLFTIDSIKDGWDPEQTRTVNGGNERYPFYRFFTAGVNVTF